MIFVSIAAYRDPQLGPTVRDCLEKAQQPERLRFGICWQHGPGEPLPDCLRGDRFTVIDVPFEQSRGVCWARSAIMDLWDGEERYLQLDSHLRFAPHWDSRLLEQAAASSRRGGRAILSAFPAPFTPDARMFDRPLLTVHDRFDDDGIPLPRGIPFADWRPGLPPRRTRFLSAAFLLAPGSFVEEVPYDPELYFHGEETALTLRAFTAGYDLYQPCDLLVWHDYSRAGRRAHWDDHAGGPGGGVAWHERDLASRRRVRELLTGRRRGAYGLGSRRTLAEYERYAGIDLRTRRVQTSTRRHLEPPSPPRQSRATGECP